MSPVQSGSMWRPCPDITLSESNTCPGAAGISQSFFQFEPSLEIELELEAWWTDSPRIQRSLTVLGACLLGRYSEYAAFSERLWIYLADP